MWQNREANEHLLQVAATLKPKAGAQQQNLRRQSYNLRAAMGQFQAPVQGIQGLKPSLANKAPSPGGKAPSGQVNQAAQAVPKPTTTLPTQSRQPAQPRPPEQKAPAPV